MARMSRYRSLWIARGLLLAITLLLVSSFASNASARRKDPAFATSANDPVLVRQIAALGPNVDPEEAQRVGQIAYTTGRDLKKEWRVVWPPGLHNFLVNTGARKGGLCFQWAERLLFRLSELKWETLEFHWAESFETTASEHNVIVVTAKGQPFSRGILLDNWRYSGRLVWGPVIEDPHYQWHENKRQAIYVLSKRPVPQKRPVPDSSPSVSKSDAEAR